MFGSSLCPSSSSSFTKSTRARISGFHSSGQLGYIRILPGAMKASPSFQETHCRFSGGTSSNVVCFRTSGSSRKSIRTSLFGFTLVFAPSGVASRIPLSSCNTSCKLSKQINVIGWESHAFFWKIYVELTVGLAVPFRVRNFLMLWLLR